MEVKDKFGTLIEVGCYSGYGIIVQGVDDDWDFQGLRLNGRKGTLLFGDRIIVLSPDKVPDRYRKLLE